MATSISRAKLIVETAEAERNLARVGKEVDEVGSAFNELKRIVAGIAIQQFISNSLNLAARLDTLGQATGIATENLRGFQLAVGQAGGNSDQANDAISDLVKNIGDAASGSGELVEAFNKAGVSLTDLRTLSEQDILKKTIDGIAKIGDSSTQSSVKAKIFGEALKTVDIGSVASNFGRLSAESGKYASAATSAREAQLKMNQAIDKLQESVVIALAPINEFIASINPQAITAFANTIVTLAKVFVGLYIVEKLTTLVSAFGLAATATTGKLGNLVNALGKSQSAKAYSQGLNTIKRELSELPSAFDRAFNPEKFRGRDVGFKMIGNTFSMMGLGLARMIPLIGQVITGIVVLDGIVAGLTGKDLAGWFDTAAASVEKLVTDKFPKLAEQLNKIGEKLGMAPSAAQTAAANKAALDHLANLKEIEEENKKVNEQIRRGQEALAKIGQAYQRNNLAAKQELDTIGETLSNRSLQLFGERQMIRLSEDQREVRQAMLALDDEMFNKQANIRREIEKITLERSLLKKGQEDERKILGDQIAILNKQSKDVEKLYGVHKQGIETQIVALQSARLVEKARLQDIENTTNAINAQISRQQALADIIRGANQQAFEVKDATQPGQLTGLSSIQRQIVEIQDSARKAAMEAARSFAANFEDDGDGLTPERARELSAGLDQIAGAYKRVAGAQIEVAKNNYETARSFSTGWQDAFARYAEDALDASKQATTYFERFTQGFEDAIVSLVTKGKFNFKDFANSIIADFARIEARKALTNFMGGGGGGSNILPQLFTFGKSLFGFANGGSMMAGQPAIVGERGPELFVPSSAGKIVANNQLGRQAQVINNAVTYTIQAVDASSFRSLVARDPNFIYAVTEQGRRSQPTRRSA